MKTQFLVIGSGIAGLNFALNVVKYGKVTVVTKKEIIESNTNLAQGGIAAVTREDDSIQLHIDDTLKGGCGLSNIKVVKILAENGLEAIRNLLSFGIKFDKVDDELHLTREGGHSKARVLHSGDTTGKEIEQEMTKNVRDNKNIEVFENCFAIELISKNKKCYGAKIFDIKNKRVFEIFANVTILATGGIGYVFQNTTNPEIATGDGIAMAYKIGAIIEDIEFVQFHPTTLNKFGAPHFLLSEALRGEGAFLVNKIGEKFMKKYDEMGDLAPRDIISRTIFNELKKHKVYLDIRHKSKNFIINRFPMIFKECLKYDIDISMDLIPISPAAHYICGGIKTNEFGETNIKNLLAYGECTCTEVHGANRLASNSLLESVVFSSLGAQKAKEYLKNKIKIKLQNNPNSISDINFSEVRSIQMELRKGMWDNVGIIRTGSNLKLMLQKLSVLKKRLNIYSRNIVNVGLLELKNMLTISNLITNAAKIRKESRGTHYRTDYPTIDDKNWKKHIYLDKKYDEIHTSFGISK